ncbi:hypothetical protein GSI_11977 [Ganoderma sinense ZZ0214-1]|uniref:DUF7770 domain-containing protein n=1 Tax=Ganoderma sinense ZZ0214-1 TaxID=1077348 RepID=A0A2G8RXJ0_9APHY|nr:hypothetical protein GSI_11977 [Ganoderma sinense ZZ0214-1]
MTRRDGNAVSIESELQQQTRLWLNDLVRDLVLPTTSGSCSSYNPRATHTLSNGAARISLLPSLFKALPPTINMKDSIYKRQFDATHDAPLPVSHISVTGTGTVSTVLEEDGKGFYHWYLTLHLSPQDPTGDARTVTLDSQPTNYPEATLIVKSAPPCTDPHKVEVTVPMLGGPTASEVVEYLVEKGLARYVYAEGGFGCRWWCRVALQKLEAKGWVESGAEDKYVELQRECAERDPERFPTYLKRGTFMPKD